jgi:hypothetical protein
MTETKISSTDAREFFGHCISCATYGDVRYIVNRWGQPMGSIIGLADLQNLRDQDQVELARLAEKIDPEAERRIRRKILRERMLAGDAPIPTTPEEVEMLGKMAVELALHKRGWGPKPEA